MTIKEANLARDRNYYFNASKLAKLSDYTTRVGAIAAHNGKVLAGAFNTIRNDIPNAPYGTATYHAEWNCVSMVSPRLLNRITLYVARIDKLGKRVASRPCNRCVVDLLKFGVKEIVYYDGNWIVKERLR